MVQYDTHSITLLSVKMFVNTQTVSKCEVASHYTLHTSEQLGQRVC